MTTLLAFLTELFDSGLGYSSINSARCAVTTLHTMCSGTTMETDSPLLTRFMKGVFHARPALPKLTCTWDVARLLRYLKSLSPAKALNLHYLSIKLATLMALLSGQRGQTLHLLQASDCSVQGGQLVLRVTNLLKTSKPGQHTGEIVLPSYPESSLCVVTVYTEYVKRTKTLRTVPPSRLFIASMKPHRPISRDTLSNWVKRAMRNAGVDVQRFGAHSTRSASTSAALTANVPLSTILQTAGWSKEDTFRKFYNKPVRRDTSFASSLLQGSQ